MKKAWVTTSCPSCGGHGMRAGFEDVYECSECGGSGRLWLSESGRVADYPGGPFRGSWPGEFHNNCARRIRALQEENRSIGDEAFILLEAMHDLCRDIATGEYVVPLGIGGGEELYQERIKLTLKGMRKEYGFRYPKDKVP